MKIPLIAFVAILSFTTSGAEEEMKQLKEVPNTYRTDLNLVPIREGKAPAMQDSVSIGTIGSNFVTFHGRRLEVSFVQVGEDKDKNFVQIGTKPTEHGGWSFILIQGKQEGKRNNWCYLTIQYDPLDLSEEGTTEVYAMVLGKKVEPPKTK